MYPILLLYIAVYSLSWSSSCQLPFRERIDWLDIADIRWYKNVYSISCMDVKVYGTNTLGGCYSLKSAQLWASILTYFISYSEYIDWSNFYCTRRSPIASDLLGSSNHCLFHWLGLPLIPVRSRSPRILLHYRGLHALLEGIALLLPGLQSDPVYDSQQRILVYT